MEDPVLNKSLEESRELQTRWNQFREFVRVAIERGKVSPEAEMKFLELKSIIAMLHDGFMSKLTHDQKTGQNIMSIIGDCIMLSRITAHNDAEKQKFEFDWNECYLLISEQVQSLEQEKTRLAGINERVHRASQRKQAIQAKIHNFLHSSGLAFVIIVGVLVLVLYVVPAYIWSYRNFKDIPGLGGAYSIVANKIYRPFLNSNYAYDGWEDLANNPNTPANMDRITREDEREMNEQYFKNSVLNEIGMTQAAATEARGLFDAGLRYERERFTADGRDVRLFYILFKTTPDARRFVDLANESLRSPDLTVDQKNVFVSRTCIIRSANFVAIGISEHTMRQGHIIEKFYLDEDTTSEFRF
jgi:hypothetical protein